MKNDISIFALDIHFYLCNLIDGIILAYEKNK